MFPIPTSTKSSSQKQVFGAAYLGKQVTLSIWHVRLGHPSNSIISQMLAKSKVSVMSKSIPMLCQNCIEVKFTKLPFKIDVSKVVHPFATVHSDV